MAQVGVPESLATIEADLLKPGGIFALESVEVLGESMLAMANRLTSLRDVVANSVGHGDGDYLVFSDGVTERRITFREHERLVASVAAALRDEYGVKPGDRVAILGANSPEWIIAFWATVSLGAVAVGLNGWWVAPEILYGIEDCSPRVLIVDRKRLDRLEGQDPGVPVIVMEDDFPRLEAYAPDAELPNPPIAEDDPAIILYTSGTTGRPKGAVHSHRNVGALIGLTFFHGLRNILNDPPAAGLPPTCQLVSSPLFHVSGLHTGAVAYLVGGVKSVWTVGRFDPAVVMSLIEKEQVTHWSFTPTMLHRLLLHPEFGSYNLSSLRSGGGGGSTFSPALISSAKESLPQLRTTFGVGYGLTECTALATLNSGAELDLFPTAVGRPLPTVEIEIRDESGHVVADGVEGDIHLRGPNIMLGYWNKPDETAAAILEGRWLRTGDVGRFEGGRLYLASRRHDLILRGGENIYPAEIEQRLEAHPAIMEVCVVGVADNELGQIVKAVCVLKDDENVDAAELTLWCSEALAYFKVPAQWEIRREPLPRNATGKVVKAVLTEQTDLHFIEED